MDVNANKSVTVAGSIASAAKGKQSSQDGEGLGGMFAEIVQAATADAAQSSSAGGLGGLFSKDRRENASDDVETSAPRSEQDWNDADDAPPVEHAAQPAPRDDYAYDAPEPVETSDDDLPRQASADHAPSDTPDEGPSQPQSQNQGQEQSQNQTQSTDGPDNAASVSAAQTVAQATAAQHGLPGQAQADQAQASTVNTAKAAVQETGKAAPTDGVAVKPQSNAGTGETAKAAPGASAPEQQGLATAATAAKAKQVKPQNTVQQQTVQADGGDQGAAKNSTETSLAAKAAQQQARQQKGVHGQQANAPVKEEAVQTATPAAVQAQELSKKLGNGSRVNVAVNVENEADTLVSKPLSNISTTDGANGKNGKTNAATAQAGQRNPAATQPQIDGSKQPQIQIQPQQAVVVPTAAQSAASGATATGMAASGGVEGVSQANGGSTAPGVQSQNQFAPQVLKPQAQAKTPQMQRAVTEQVSVQIAKAVGNGMDKISIRLNPASLGRVDVQLEMSQDGRVIATVMADNKDTLDLLQRDSRELTKALQNAGLNTDSGDLNFNLRGEGSEGQEQEKGLAGKTSPSDLDLVEQPLDVLLSGETEHGVVSEDRVNIQV